MQCVFEFCIPAVSSSEVGMRCPKKGRERASRVMMVKGVEALQWRSWWLYSYSGLTVTNDLFTIIGPYQRPIKVCPVEGCTSKPQRKLWNRFEKFHPTIRGEERKKIKRAKIVRTKQQVSVHARPLSGQTTIEAAFSQRPPKPLRLWPKSAPPTSTLTTSHVGTRAMPQFDIDD